VNSTSIFLSLGSNLGDREANLAGAITILGEYNENNKLNRASFYNTEPVFNKGQPDFINTVVNLDTIFDPFEFLDEIKKIEELLGRPRKRKKNTARTIDIDILTFGDSFIETAELTIPHVGIPFRRFVLVPFVELAPNYIIHGWNVSIKELLKNCSDKSTVTKYFTYST